MAKDKKDREQEYEEELRALQMELVKLQRYLIAEDRRVLVIFEGRDGAGKDGTIKRLTEHMAPRETRIFAPSKPSDVEMTQWYFQRFVPQLPGADHRDNHAWRGRSVRDLQSLLVQSCRRRAGHGFRHRSAGRKIL